MTCQELAEFIIDYVDGTLPDDVQSTFESHLSVCPSCIEYIKSYRTCQRVLDDLGCEADEAVPCEVPEELIQAILAARKTQG